MSYASTTSRAATWATLALLVSTAGCGLPYVGEWEAENEAQVFDGQLDLRLVDTSEVDFASEADYRAYAAFRELFLKLTDDPSWLYYPPVHKNHNVVEFWEPGGSGHYSQYAMPDAPPNGFSIALHLEDGEVDRVWIELSGQGPKLEWSVDLVLYSPDFKRVDLRFVRWLEDGELEELELGWRSPIPSSYYIGRDEPDFRVSYEPLEAMLETPEAFLTGALRMNTSYRADFARFLDAHWHTMTKEEHDKCYEGRAPVDAGDAQQVLAKADAEISAREAKLREAYRELHAALERLPLEQVIQVLKDLGS